MMNAHIKTFFKSVFFTFILFCAIFASIKLSNGVETSVYSLLGGNGFLSHLSEQTSSFIRIICSNEKQVEECKKIFDFEPPVDFSSFYETIRTHGKGLLSTKSRVLLEQNETNKIIRSALRRDYGGVGLFSKEDDPYYFLTDFLLALKALQPTPKNEGMQILTGTVKKESSINALKALIDLAKKDESLYLSGAAFHTILSTEKTKSEINVLGSFSIVVVILCGWMLFRNFRFIIPTMIALVSGFIAGSAAVSLFSSRPHALTFLFGTTLIGLGVDYCYHALSEERTKNSLLKLTYALITTCLSFSPLLFSNVAVLREMAIFTIVGLITIYCCAWIILPTLKSEIVIKEIFNERKIKFLKVALSMIFIVLLVGAGIVGFSFECNPSQFYRPQEVLARGEKAYLEQFGDSLNKLALVPLRAWQEENASLKGKMGEVKGEFLEAKDLPQFLLVNRDGTDYLILPSSFVGDKYEVISLKDELQKLFEKLSHETMVLLAISFVIFFVVTALIFRKRFIRIIMPLLMAVLSTSFLLAIFHQPFHFFQLLSFFILFGLGIDYSIFHNEASDVRVRRIVLYSFLTSLAGFGILSFTSFPVTRSMGLTLGIGLLFTYVYSFIWSDKRSKANGSEKWSEQKEQSAGRFRILILLYIYRFLGKDVSKILFLPAFLVMYPFCVSARKALKEYYDILGIVHRPFRHLLSFAWSVFDKTDACSFCKNPPKMRLVGDTSWVKGGVFLLSSHLGCSEVLPALRANDSGSKGPIVHGFQQLSHNAIFTNIFLKYLNKDQVVLHAVEDIGVETAVEMKDALDRGEIVLMAADRLSANTNRNMEHNFFGKRCLWPKGVFRFAKLMDCPTYGIVCVKTGWNSYDVLAKRLDNESLLSSYVEFLEGEVKKHPYQWYQFYSFWKPMDEVATARVARLAMTGL